MTRTIVSSEHMTGESYYDADGNGVALAQLIATPSSLDPRRNHITIVNGSAPGQYHQRHQAQRHPHRHRRRRHDQRPQRQRSLRGSAAPAARDVINGGTRTDSSSSGPGDQRVWWSTSCWHHHGRRFRNDQFHGRGASGRQQFRRQLTGAAGGQALTGQVAPTRCGEAGSTRSRGAGGDGAFVFREIGSANADRVSDFDSGADKLQLDDAAFTLIGAMGKFALGTRLLGSSSGAAHDSNDRVLYNTSTGQALLRRRRQRKRGGAADRDGAECPGRRRDRHRRNLTTLACQD